MSWSDRLTALRLSSFVLLTLTLGACGFRPLYSDSGAAGGTGPTAVTSDIGRELANVSIATSDTREAIALRNNLIFALTGNGDESPTPTYRLDYTVGKASSPFTVEAVSGRQTASFVTINVNYTLTTISDGKKVFTGHAIGRASYDKPAQRFAAIRAERDAEDRAVTDASDAIRNALASYFAGKGKAVY